MPDHGCKVLYLCYLCIGVHQVSCWVRTKVENLFDFHFHDIFRKQAFPDCKFLLYLKKIVYNFYLISMLLTNDDLFFYKYLIYNLQCDYGQDWRKHTQHCDIHRSGGLDC